MDNNQLVDVIKTLKKTELVFGTNNCTLRVGKSDVKVEDQDGDELISIYPEIREREYRVLYSSPTLNKHGTSTAQELVDFWELNNFFFDVGSQVIADGRVEFRADLPITIGFPAVGAIYFVEKPTIIALVWKQYTSGDYIKDTDTGSLSDWRKTNKKSRFTTSEFRVLDNVDQSKQLAFDVSRIPASTTRTPIWPNLDGQVSYDLVNTITVRKKSDFPAPIAGVINFVDDRLYLISGGVDVGTDRIKLGINNAVYADADASLNKLTYTGVDALFTGEDVTFTFNTVDIICPNGTVFNMKNTAGNEKTNNLFIRQMTFLDVDKIAEIENMGNVIARNVIYGNIRSGGFKFVGSDNGLFFFFSSLLVTFGGKFLDFNSSVWDTIVIDTSEFAIPVGAIFLDGAIDSGNLSAIGIARMTNCNFRSAGTILNNITSGDLRWRMLLNIGVADSTVLAELSISASASTTILDGTFGLLAGTTVLDEAERIITPSNMALEYDGLELVKKRVTWSGVIQKDGGADKLYDFAFFLNDVKIDKSEISGLSLSSSAGSVVTLGTIIDLDTMDKIDIRVEGVGTTDPITATTGKFIVGG